MGNNFCFANAETPRPGKDWASLSDNQRLLHLESALETKMPSLKNQLQLTAAKQDGQVIVSLYEQLPADKRGTFLLDLEAFLKNAIDPGIVVWMEALGDKNSLRNLRGIEVKS